MQSKSKPKPKTKTAQQVVDRFDASWQYAQQKHHNRWKRNWKLYNNERAIVSYEGITNTFVPMVFSTVETLTAALAAGRPSIDFVPQDMYRYIMSYYQTGKKPDLKALNAQFDYYWDCDNWDLKSIKTIRGAFIYGIAAEWIYWDIDKPRVINLHPRDLIVDPALTDPMQLLTDPKRYYGGRRYMTTKQALKDERIADPDKPGFDKPRFKNVDSIVPGFTGDAEDSDWLKDAGLGAIGDTKDLVEVIEIHDGERIRSVAQRTLDIEDRKNDLGIIPLALHRFIAHESVIYGKSIIDPIAHPQELLNDITNQSVDAVTDILSPQFELDPMYADMLPMVTNAPGTVYPFRPGSLQMIGKNPVPNSAFNERQNIKNEIREATGADQVVKGVASDESATATEINAQLNQAGQRFELYVRMLEKEAFYQRSKIVYRMMLHYQRDMQLVPTNSLDGPKFHAFDPKQFDDTYEPKIQLEAHVRTQKAREQQSSTANYQILIQDPTNNLWHAKKILYPKMFDITEEELDRIIGSQEPPPPPQPGMAGAMGGAPLPGEGPLPAETSPVEAAL